MKTEFNRMPRRKLLSVLTIGSGAVLAGCDDSANREIAFREMIKDGVSQVKKALETTESDVGEFELKDWRDVVPEVKSSLGDLRSAVDDLEKMLEPPDVD